MLSPQSRRLAIAFLVLVLIGIGWLFNRSNTSARPAGCGCGGPSVSESEAAIESQTTFPTKTGELAAVSPGLPRLVDFGSTTCVPCKMMAPILEELAREYHEKLIVEFIDISKNRSAVQRYRVRAIPTQVFYDENGREFFRHMGFYSKRDILAKFEEREIELGKGDSE